MRYLTFSEVLEVHRQVMAQSGRAEGLMHLPALESALAQPQMTFGGEDLYPTLVDKAAALGYALIKNHPFLDGNKRTGHAAMEVFLVLNGYEIRATVDEQEHVILQMAASEIDREEVHHVVADSCRSQGLSPKNACSRLPPAYATLRLPAAAEWQHYMIQS